MNRAAKYVWVLLVMLAMSPGRAADLSAEQVRAILGAAEPDKPANLSGRSLENLDLSNVDFKRAKLSGSNLYGAKLDGADLSGANLARAKLDLEQVWPLQVVLVGLLQVVLELPADEEEDHEGQHQFHAA